MISRLRDNLMEFVNEFVTLIIIGQILSVIYRFLLAIWQTASAIC